MKTFLKITMLAACISTLYSCGSDNKDQADAKENQTQEMPADSLKSEDSLATTPPATPDSANAAKETEKQK